jgi:putative ABC transport system ATP-binding protein
MSELSADLGKTIVMVTHDAIAAAAASRTLHLEKGQLIEQSRISKADTNPNG